MYIGKLNRSHGLQNCTAKIALKVSKFPLVLLVKPLIRAKGSMEFSHPEYSMFHLKTRASPVVRSTVDKCQQYCLAVHEIGTQPGVWPISSGCGIPCSTDTPVAGIQYSGVS